MKVAFFLGSLKRGGAESLVYDICMRRDCAPFELCCLYRKDDDYSDAFKASGAELIQVIKDGNMLSYLWKLRKAILAHHIDIVHAQTPSNALVSIVSLLFTRVKILTSFHGFSFSDAPKWYWKLIYGCSKRIVCVSDFQKRFYENKWGLPDDNKLRVIYNGINFSKLDRPEPDRSHPLALDKESLNMMMVGSFIEGRSQSFICQVMQRLNLTGKPFNMYFAGRRDDAEPWRYDDCVSFCERNGLADKVHFLGNRADIPYLLRQMDLFLYASEHDTFGIAVIEALASGTPVLVNDWDVMKEITDDGKLAQLYQTDDIDDCLNKILAFAESGKAVFQDGAIARETVRERYSIERHIQQLNELYLSFCQ